MTLPERSTLEVHCDVCGRPLTWLHVFHRRRTCGRRACLKAGTHAALAAGLDAYHAANLREALRLVPDTGDWHGSLRIACDMALARDGEHAPNQTAEQMAELVPHRLRDLAASSPSSRTQRPEETR